MRRRRRLVLGIILAGLPSAGIAQVPSRDVQVAGAVLAAPAGFRDGATVLGYNAAGRLVTLRQGTGEMVCLADDPGDDGFSVACYHESLGPYMARGRELREQGVSQGGERNSIRWREAEEGRLSMPATPAFLYVLTGAAFDAAAGQVEDAFMRYVIYVPGATSESTGLPTRPETPGGPWLMAPGTPGAHIMITPPRGSSRR